MPWGNMIVRWPPVCAMRAPGAPDSVTGTDLAARDAVLYPRCWWVPRTGEWRSGDSIS